MSREPGSDDDLGELLVGIDEPDHPAYEINLRSAGERRLVVWLEGHLELLSRCAKFGELARPQPK